MSWTWRMSCCSFTPTQLRGARTSPAAPQRWHPFFSNQYLSFYLYKGWFNNFECFWDRKSKQKKAEYILTYLFSINSYELAHWPSDVSDSLCAYLCNGTGKVKWKQLREASWATHSRGNSKIWKKRTCRCAQRLSPHTHTMTTTHTHAQCEELKWLGI